MALGPRLVGRVEEVRQWRNRPRVQADGEWQERQRPVGVPLPHQRSRIEAPPRSADLRPRAEAQESRRRALDRLRRGRRAARLTLGELVDEYLWTHQAEPSGQAWKTHLLDVRRSGRSSPGPKSWPSRGSSDTSTGRWSSLRRRHRTSTCRALRARRAGRGSRCGRRLRAARVRVRAAQKTKTRRRPIQSASSGFDEQ